MQIGYISQQVAWNDYRAFFAKRRRSQAEWKSGGIRQLIAHQLRRHRYHFCRRKIRADIIQYRIDDLINRQKIGLFCFFHHL